MKFFTDESIIWQSTDKAMLLTDRRICERKKSWLGSSIKSIMLEELDSCELRTDMKPQFLRNALLYFLTLNGLVYLLNHYLFKAELLKMFFEDLHLNSFQVMIVFYLSLVVAMVYIWMFLKSITKVCSFYSSRIAISLELKRMTFEDRDHFISMVEEAKDRRLTTSNETVKSVKKRDDDA